MLEGKDLESPFNTFRVLSSTIMPLPEYGMLFSAVLFVSVILLLLESFDDFLDFGLPELVTMDLMKRSCDWTRRFSKSHSTDVAEEDASFFLAMYSSTSFRRLVFSSRKASSDCSNSDVRDFLRKRLFFACLRFRSLSSEAKIFQR